MSYNFGCENVNSQDLVQTEKWLSSFEAKKWLSSFENVR